MTTAQAKNGNGLRAQFSRFARNCASAMGHPWAFGAALLTIIIWAVTGPIFGFSDTWQLAINTGTTIVTFLMVFLIQNTQNRDGRAIQLKLDLEQLTQEDLNKFLKTYQKIAHESRRLIRQGLKDTGTPEAR